MSSQAIGVIGGGISGLSSLHFLSRSKAGSRPSPKLFERETRVGGWIRTDTKSTARGHTSYMLEKGPRSIRGKDNGQVTLGLVAQLGLSKYVETPSNYGSKRFLYTYGEITKMPESVLEVFKSPLVQYSPWLILDALAHRNPSSTEDESIATFFSRHLGQRATLDIVGGVVVGIYGGNIEKLSMKSCFPSIYENTAKHGSLIRGLMFGSAKPSMVDEVSEALHMTSEERALYKAVLQKVKIHGGMYSFKNGVGSLTSKLREIHQENIEVSSPVTGISKNEQTGQITIHRAGSDSSAIPWPCEPPQERPSPILPKDSLSFDQLISAIPSYELAPILQSISPKTSELLSQIEFVNMAVVTFLYEEKKGHPIIPDKYKGFGYLVPPVEDQSILGVSFDSITFPVFSIPPTNLVRIAVMVGGDKTNNLYTPDLKYTSQNDVIRIAMRALSKHIGIEAHPVDIDVFVAKRAIPQYTIGHEERIKAIESQLALDLPQLHLAGASYYGVSVNDCVVSGMKAAQSALAKL
jgi:oxygen-dependent protoporphyrinogen oxidase